MKYDIYALKSLSILMMFLSIVQGCTWQDGTPYASMQQLTLELTFDQTQGRWENKSTIKSNKNYHIKIQELSFKWSDVLIEYANETTSTSPSSTEVFDPSNPPAGCTLCHNGHCHCDGELVSYQDLQKSLNSSEASDSNASLSGFSLNWSQEVVIQDYDQKQVKWQCNDTYQEALGDCDLPLTQLKALQLFITSVDLSVVIEDPLQRMPTPLELDLTLPIPLTIKQDFTWEITEDRYQELEAKVRLLIPTSLFDSIQWEDEFSDVMTEKQWFVNHPIPPVWIKQLQENLLPLTFTQFELKHRSF